MNMEANGTTDEPMGITIAESIDNHQDVTDESDSAPKLNGTNTEVSENIEKDVENIDKGTADVDTGSESDVQTNEEISDPLAVESSENVESNINDSYDNLESNANDSSEITEPTNNDSTEIDESDVNNSSDKVENNLNNESNESPPANAKETHSEVEENSVVEEPKPVEKMQLRRSSRGIKRKRYDDDGSDIEDPPPVVHKKQTSYKQSMPKQFHQSTHIPNMYQRVLGPNTTLTPVSVKNKIATIRNAHNAQAAILPSLTDDMFVVEAPSFIVPYVYEKPPIEPLKEYVEKLRKEILEQKNKTDDSKETDENDSQSSKANGETADDSEEEKNDLEEIMFSNDVTKKEPEAKKERRPRNYDEDDKSWDGESSSDSTEEMELDKEESAATPATANKTNKIDYFDLTLGKFFTNIGLNLVKQYVQTDLLKQQTRKLIKEKRTGQETKPTEISIISLKKNIVISARKNSPFLLQQRKCDYCTFKSESLLALSHHLETPHMKNNVYKCNFCTFEIKSPHDILFHMESEHSIRAKLERAPAYHQCPNCPFEDNGKGKLARHQIACAKRYKPDLNLAPPFEWEPPAKILMVRARTPMMSSFQYNFTRAPLGNNHIGKPIMNNMFGANNFRVRLRPPMPTIARNNPVQGISILRGGATIRPSISPSALIQSNFASGSKPKLSNQPSISITPLPRQVQLQQRQSAQQNKNSCVICEICDGYIKDLEQLRSHMQWIHRVKIHPKMMTNSPPLNCQKCQLRFFTDQGLERHLLGSHGLVTMSMQEEANKGNDGGRCPVCGRIYQWKLLDHVARDHKMTLKPAHLSYKCTVCSAIFGLYKQFENHVYSAHSVVAKRVMNKGKSLPPSKIGQSLLKPLRNRGDLTITPTSGRALSSDDDDDDDDDK